MEVAYPYSVSSYEPSLAVLDGELGRGAGVTPEETMQRFLLTMKNGEKSLNDLLWTESSRLQLAEADVANQRPSSFWETSWKKLFSSAVFKLKSKTVYRRFVVIEWSALIDGKTEVDSTVLIEKNGRWFVSNEYASHPLVDGSNNGQGRIQRLADDVFEPLKKMR